MNLLQIPCKIGEVSDGYHTFDELYEHRHALFLALMRAQSNHAWFSRLHADESGLVGWFVAGLLLPSGPITYHLPERLWEKAQDTGAKERDKAPEYDGHTSKDVIRRLLEWI